MTVRAAAASGLVALGVVGAGRRLLELRQRRRGRAAPLGPATMTLARSRLGRLGDAVERWEPRRPTTDLGRAAAAAWAAPVTTLGALLVLSGGGRARWDSARGCWVATDVGGLSGRVLRLMNFDANTLGQVVVSVGRRPSAALLDHEAAHVRQGERLGPLVLPLYVWFSARHGYRDNPLERNARRRALEVRPRS